MNVYDKAHELARELKLSGEVRDYKNAADKIKGNPKSRSMVDDFRKKQFELYSLQMQGKQPSKEQIDAINNLAGIAMSTPDVREFMESEMKFSKLWQDIMKILEEAVDVDINK